ncbi:MAG: oxidoreductase [Haloplasmataceae bacterium]|jgi:predicted dehydrogenase|nr:oxidoreductase [Haloplasmataceae bacterium]
MKNIKVGVIGCGIISNIHLDAIKKNKNAKLIVVCDKIIERAKIAANKYQCEYTDQVSDLLSLDLDVIHILTPHYTHYEIAKVVLESGKNCLLEKPMTINTQDALDLIKISDGNKNQKLGIVFQNRLNTTSQEIKNIIDNKTYGALKGIKASVTWLRDKDYYSHDDWRGKWATEGGGVLINQAIHTLDLIQWFGGEIDTISGSYGTYVLNDYIEVEDTATMIINFKNNSRGLLFATNNHATNSPIEIELVFEQGVLTLSDSKLYMKLNNQLKLLCEDNSGTGSKAYWGLGHEMLINNFYDSIINNENKYINAREAAQTIEILEKFYKYANQNLKIKIENTKEWSV